MSASTNKSILITPGSYSSLTTSVSQIDLKWYESGIGTFVFVPNSGDLRSTIYNWQQNSEPVILFGGIGTYNNQRKFVGPYQDFSGSFTGITDFPYIQFFPLSGTINANTINVTGVASFTQIYVNGLSTIGSLYLPGSFYDNTFSPGTLGQFLQSTGSGIAWTSVNTTGIITASGGIPNRVTKFLDEDTIGNSTITDTGTTVSIGVGLTVNGAVTSFGFYGPGTFITNINASNLASGTVPSDRVTGSYSGITSVGNLDLLNVIGIASAFAFVGDGANLSNLNASNLTSGIIPSARVIGDYSGITSVGTLSQLIVSGFSTVNTIRISGSLYDSTFSPGLNNQFLISTGSGIAWTTVSATGILTGSGTLNAVAKFGSSNSLVDSKITDTGSVVTIGVGLSVSGFSSSFGFYGPGTFITNLNASNLASGTVPSDRVVGSYSGITSVGTLTQLNINGLTTATAFLGNGANLTNLNADNLSSGTVASARISGAYSGITSVGNLSSLNVLGITSVVGLDLNGPVYDINNTSGQNGQILTTISTGVAWSSINSLGIITGNIQPNQVAVGGPASSITGFTTLIFNNIGLSVGTSVPDNKLTVEGNVKSTGVVIGSQLISTVFAPVPPLIVNSTTQVTNLNAEYWGNQYYPLTTTGDLLYSSDNTGTAARLAPNTSTIIKVLTQVGNGTEASAPSWQPLPTAGFIQYFFTGLAASNAPNNFQLANDLPVGLGTTTVNVASGEILVGKYITAPGVPNLEYLPAGNLSAYVWGSQTLGTSSIQLRVDFYETSAFGTSINKIVSTNDSTALTSSAERFTLIGITTTTYNLASRSSRIQAQVYAVHGGAGIASVNVFYGDGFDSLVQIVAPGADVTNFVPYQGAVNDVDLGTKNLQAGAVGLYTGFSTVSPIQGQFVWNSTTQEVDLGLGDGYSVSVGFENALRVYNNTLNPLGVGSVVYVTGSAGNVPTVSLAQANTFQSGTVLGVVSKTIPAANYGYVFTYGTVEYNTSSFNAGDNLFLSATQSGILTNISPLAPNFSILIGAALNSTTSGSIVVLQNSINTLNEPNRILFANSSKFPQGISTFVYSNGNVGIGTSSPTQSLHVQGNFRLSGGLYDSNNGPGTLNQILSSTGAGIAWTSINTTGIITASGGTPNRVTKFLDEDTIGNSTITDNGLVVTVGVGMSVLGFTSSAGFYGPGTFITNLNASNLASGTVPSTVVTGSYSGITSVGTLTQLITTGFATASGFFGPGTFITNLNASNLASGTVPSARISGAYSGITSVGSLSQLIVTGFSTINNIRISGSLYDSSFSPGSANQVLISTGSGIAWTTSTSTGILTGSGTINTVPKFNTANSLTNSNITDNGIAVTVGSQIFINGIGSFTGDITVNTITVGLGSGQVATNVAIGFQALLGVTTGVQVTAVGYQAGQANTIGQENTFIGYLAGRTNTSGSYNIALGAISLFANTSGGFNVAVGRGALTANTIGNNNAALGHGALSANTSGSNNAAFGFLAVQNNVTTSGNTGIGRDALRYYANSDNQTAVGFGALQGSGTVALNTGTGNVAIGYRAGFANTSGSNNVFVGETAGLANTTGSSNVFIGNQVAQVNTSGSNNIAIGFLALVNNTIGSFNVAHGSEALRYYTATSNQTAIGYQALRGNSTTTLNTGNTNTAVGYQAGLANTSGSGNTFVGYIVGRANTTGQENTFVGNAAGYLNTTGSFNNVFGSSSLSASNTGNANQVFGYLALFVNTSGGNNHAFGNNSLESNTTASNNVAFGNQTLTRVATNGNNVAVGFAALRYTTAANQVAMGHQALQGSATTELNTGTQNTALGYQAGTANTSGSSNVFVGYQAGLANTSGSENIAVGVQALLANITGTGNVALGQFTLAVNTAGGNSTAVGQYALQNNTAGGNSAFGATALRANTTGIENTAIGYVAMVANTTGFQNSALGLRSMQNNTTGGGNVAIGRDALRYYQTSNNQTAVGTNALAGNSTVALNTGTQNTAIGANAGIANSSGSDNSFAGFQAGVANTTGSFNTFVGSSSGASNTSGDRNASLGHQALQSNTINGQNVAVGQAALRYFDQPNQTAVGWQALQGSSTVALNTGVQNVALGYQAGLANTSGSNNSYLGLRAGAANTSGNNNIFVGSSAGASIVSGSNNIVIGTFADGAIGSQYQIAIGIAVAPTASNMGAWGRNSNSLRTDLGIGTYTPLSRLHVETLASGNMGLYIAGSVSQTADLVEINATTAGQNYFTITGIGSVGIYTNTPSQALDVNGGTRLRGRLFDNSNSAGSANQVLISTGTGIAWTTSTATGILTGSGTINTVPKFNTANSLTNSNITDSGTQIVLGSASSISGIVTSFGYFGPGTNITNLNASNLTSGIVPSLVVTGSYSGITSVGTQSQLIVSGFSTLSNVQITGALYDGSFSSGTTNQILISTGAGISWTSATATGIVTGSGSASQVTYWAGTSRITGNNLFVYNGIGSVGIGTNIPEYALHVVGTMAATIKSFIIDHPTQSGRKLRYASLEGPENGVYVRGRNSEPIIILPNYWTGLVDENTITVNITPVGKYQNIYVEKIVDYVVYVKCNSMFCTHLDYFYTVYGERKDVNKLEVEI